MEYGGRLGSFPVEFTVVLVVEDATATAEERGAVKVCFIREKMDVTRV